MSMARKSPFDGGPSDTETVRRFVGGQMVRGALVATVMFFGPLLFIWALWFVGTFLPPESKEALDPTPDSFPHLVEEATE